MTATPATEMFDFHTDKARYFEFQYLATRDHIIPFVADELPQVRRQLRILEIGCAEAGVLKAFTELGHDCVGVELSDARVELAEQFLAAELDKGLIRFVNKDVYDVDVESDLGGRFDLVILKDVIEHIPEQERFIPRLKSFLNPGGVVFFGFPPWHMPFGGHQQVCRNRILAMTPWIHLLPRPLLTALLNGFGERPATVRGLLEVKDTGISTARFERIVRSSGMRVVKRRRFLINPMYSFKFGLKPRRQSGVVSGIPVLRDFASTAVYYLVAQHAAPAPRQ